MRLFLKFDEIRDALFTYLERRSKTTLFSWSLGLTALTGTLDYFTGGYSFILFYLIPIFLGSWFINRTAGTLICIVSFGSSLLVNPLRYVLHHYTHPSFYYWDISLEFIYLLLLSLMFSTLRAQFNTEREMSRIDHLTRALNRRGLLELVTYEMAQCSRHNRELSMAFLDLDNFKTINDQRGHAEGDRVLCAVVSTLRKTLRQADTIARVGGDEFVVMLPQTDAEAAGELLRKVQKQLLISMENQDWPVTFSIGLITYVTPQGTAEELIARVDQLMYSIKNRNKNGLLHRVVP
ncbi:GGDEF domain-containing protein [Geopsychrobacter electrodiphilus]|uniref:GGDEF domain-containing protein n=1 Tax=Geopsychrobacter electrodiphilus TaxID=225196 RepID=UPI000371D9C8|nr:GGDEF domain-containing protein [Geopsychrobacter electrodiphilus]